MDMKVGLDLEILKVAFTVRQVIMLEALYYNVLR